ncbi:RNA dependent RNA polymerase-domain-containing protein [Podospora appendiculata]|uniref:RNA-dependent RNA polymerase n=1 Tax=Podospora appendiculata TaxID=314037 RepID=A0AAE0X0B4_9PEZI|nr:RNA dependent RNA polymerase-domain-containing protein [Podospora appendiculata]
MARFASTAPLPPRTMPSTMSNPSPSTPRKYGTPRNQDTSRNDDNPVIKTVEDLNAKYGLAIRIPDGSLTPCRRQQLAEKDESFRLCARICKGLHFCHYRSEAFLNEVLDIFLLEAKAASQNWVPKPRANPTTLPSSRIPPRARTAGEQLQMQKLLAEILSNFVPTPGTPSSSSRPLAISNNGHSARLLRANSPLQQASQPSARPKRPSYEDESDDQSPKRVKERAGPSIPILPIASAFDKVPTRQRTYDPAVEELGRDIPGRKSNKVSVLHHESSHSSEESHSFSVFSQSNHTQQQQPTQSTVTAPSQERKRAAIPPTVIQVTSSQKRRELPLPAHLNHAARSDDAFSVCSDDLRALHESWVRPDAVKPDAAKKKKQFIRHHDVQFKEESCPSSPTASTVYSNIPEFDEIAIPDTREPDTRKQVTETREPVSAVLESRLENIWPKFPRWLREAPLGVAWEITRICLHCGVDLDDRRLSYDPAWTRGMAEIWKSLRDHDLFRGKSFPERPTSEAFAAAMANFESKGNAVVLCANLDFNPAKTGPLFLLDMKPLRLDQGCRLTRRFGPDRFFEVLVPSPTSLAAPQIVRDPGGAEQVIKWLTQQSHQLVGRQWQAFYTKDAGYRKPAREFRLGPDIKPTFKDRVNFFAESGHDFRPVNTRTRQVVPAHEPVNQRSEFKVSQMLDWLLQIEDNQEQPHLKLFSRIQLGLSKTYPVLVFEPDQIIDQPEDLLSPTGKVMNDGIGLMSRSVARKVRDVLGLTDIPSAVQGRMGPAKGMWLMDVLDTGDADWIQTYPSQRKWKCNYADVHQRTLEVRSVASELKSAGLNLQLLPVLEDRAADKEDMRKAIAARLTNDLQRQFDTQKAALKRPLQFRQWVTENFSTRADRVKHGQIPFLAGLPENKEAQLQYLLNSGFDPTKQKYLQEMAWDLQKQKCDTLKTKLNIKVGKSAYIYMVVDFWGILEENEVHVGFSSKFRDDLDDASYTLLADQDILVARSPAHFVSDVQKVRAVFKSELHALKDVIVFSSKGDIPLADKLSGGDYDGDMAWVCWDPDIVNGFQNADVPPEEERDVSRYIRKDQTTFGELLRNAGRGRAKAKEKAVYDMIGKSFLFAMQPNFLGICTNYKERFCYHTNSVSSEAAVILSSLVGNLVDQSKQGIIFNTASWDQLRKELGGRSFYDDPAYKGESWGQSWEPRHIIDYLKFAIAKPAIDNELKAFHIAMQADKKRPKKGDEEPAHHWDPELAVYYEEFKSIGDESRSIKALLTALTNAIGEVELDWKRTMTSRDSDLSYPAKVNLVYEKWRALTPREANRNCSRVDSKMVRLLEQPYLTDPESSYWALLKASTAFKMCYQTNPKFAWQMGGRQLAFIKAQMAGGGDGVSTLVSPLMFAGLMPDKKFVTQYLARLDGDGSEYPDPEDAAGFGDSDDEDMAGAGFGGDY